MALRLTRKRGEAVWIGAARVEIGKNCVFIDAPPDVPILRDCVVGGCLNNKGTPNVC